MATFAPYGKTNDEKRQPLKTGNMTLPTHPDKVLMAAISEDDYVSYNQLFGRYYTRLCQYAFSILQDKDEAEDVAQELFLRLWRDRGKIRVEENVASYLFQMAKHLSLNALRAKRPTSDLASLPDIPALAYEDRLLEREEFRVSLYDCIDRLPGRSREVLLLHRVEGLRQAEIAERMSISLQTIRNQLWTSLRRLRSCLEAKGL